ncbi:MAG: Gfo/Idh/MocA family oxidoreductase [Defluviitaleaceae bacterium]|nr:Gfo/Idh/MocA family oxidoreductase [Defluviitaleaceae bacterium]
MEKIKLGIIGLGLAWERLHAPALARLSDRFEIVAVCDKDMKKASEVAKFLGLPMESAYSDYNALLSRRDIEAVETLVPIRENYEVAVAAITKGKHLVAEKPFASTPEAARNLIRLKDRYDVKVMVAENIRYDEENVLIKYLISGGQIGNPVYFIDNNVMEYREDAEKGGFAQTRWRQQPEFEGGVLLDTGVHHMARLRYLFGDVINVFAHGRPSALSFSPFSCINALLSFPDSVAGHYSFFVTGKETQSPLVGLRIFGTHGEIYLEERHCGFVNITYKDDRPGVAIPYTPGQGYYHELEDFHTALRLGGKIESTPEKALGDIETVFAMLESATANTATRVTQAYVLPQAKSATQKLYST